MSNIERNNSSVVRGPGRAHSDATSDVLPLFKDHDFYLNISDVTIGAQIGQGAFSKVYVGKYLGELVAVKKQRRSAKDGLEAYLLRELAVLKHFEHPNLLSYIGASDVFEKDGDGCSYVYIVTELTEHGDLLALLLGDHSLSWKLRVKILQDASRALEFLHSKSLIHRDIKSPNILLDKDFNCKIADFGMARELGSNMTIVGTDAYMAPELMFDEPYDTSADIYSFGIVVWECIHRKKAGLSNFCERSPMHKFKLNLEELSLKAPEDTPQSMSMLAKQLCEYDPEMRPLAEDTLLWLEDLYNEMSDEDDGSRNFKPIDYEAFFDSDNFNSTRTNSEATKLHMSPPHDNDSNVDTREMKVSDKAVNVKSVGFEKSCSSISSTVTMPSAMMNVEPTRMPVKKAGFLHKKSKGGLKSWKKRWFVIDGTKLVWYRDSNAEKKDARGFLDLKGCFIVRGLYYRWKILNSDGAAEQEAYNVQFAANSAQEREDWIYALESTMEAADVIVKSLKMEKFKTNEMLDDSKQEGVRTYRAMSVVASHCRDPTSIEDWLCNLGLGHLIRTFREKKYDNIRIILEFGLNNSDIEYLEIEEDYEKKLLKASAPGMMEKALSVKISGFFNFGSVLVYRLESKFRFLRASVLFKYQDFEEVHKKMKLMIKDHKYQGLIPHLPPKPAHNAWTQTFGTMQYAAQMARLQQDLDKYMQKVVNLVGTNEPLFTTLCGQLELLPSDPYRLDSQINSVQYFPKKIQNDSVQKLKIERGHSSGSFNPSLTKNFPFISKNMSSFLG